MKQKLNVLVVNSDLTSNGGIASVIKTLYNANIKMGTPVNFHLLKTSHFKDKPLIFEIILLVRSFFTCIYTLSVKHIDIVHIHTSAEISFYRKSLFFILAKLFRKQTIVHLHSGKFYKFFLTNSSIKASLIRFVFKHSDRVIALCSDWGDKIKQRYPGTDVVVVHNPIDIEEYAPNETRNKRERELQIVFLAFLIPSKGVEDIISLARMLKERKVSNLRLLIGGKGELENRLLSAIEEYDLAEIVHFKGWVSGNEKKELLSDSDVYFLPSYIEGMPVSILEAMCNRLAIISTRIAGIPDLVKDEVNGYLRKPGDIEGFLELLIGFAAEPERARKMGLESYNIVQEFDSSRILDQLITIYNELSDSAHS